MKYIYLRDAVMNIVGKGLPADSFPIFKYIPNPSEIKLKQLLQSFHQFFYDEFKKHRERFDPGEPCLINKPVIFTHSIHHKTHFNGKSPKWGVLNLVYNNIKILFQC